MRPVETTRKLYEDLLVLDSEREYQITTGATAYPLRVLILDGAPSGHTGEKQTSATDLLAGLIRFGSGVGPLGPVKWYLEGYLDLPLALDVSANIPLDI